MNWDQRPRVFELDGGYAPQPVPAGYVEPPQGRQVVETVEPARGWWTQAGKFGLRAQLRPDQVVEGVVIPLTENLSLPGPPKPWWVQFFRFDRNKDTEESSPCFELRARIIYGVGGVQNTIECDLMQGIQLPVVCNSITVAVVPYSPRPGDIFSSGPVTVGVMFGEGAGGGALPPTYTYPFVTQETDPQSFSFVLPDFARSVCLHTTTPDPDDLANVTLSFIVGGAGMKVVNCQELYAQLTQEKGIAIPAGTNEIILSAATDTVGESFTLQFFLAF